MMIVFDVFGADFLFVVACFFIFVFVFLVAFIIFLFFATLFAVFSFFTGVVFFFTIGGLFILCNVLARVTPYYYNLVLFTFFGFFFSSSGLAPNSVSDFLFVGIGASFS
jgi:hypothetical protein